MLSLSSAGASEVFVDQEISGPLLFGLHQTTQPLTILQGTLELALLNAGTLEEYKNAIERSLAELQRVKDSFEQLRTVARLHQRVSDVTTVEVVPMVRGVLTSLTDRSKAVGVELVLRSQAGAYKDSAGERVSLSQGKVSLALKIALSELLRLLESGSRVVVLIEAASLDIVIRATAACGAQQNAKSADVGLSRLTSRQKLARDLADSAGGELTFLPKGILFRLPRVQSANHHGESVAVSREVAHV
jgi:hypothetical protein